MFRDIYDRAPIIVCWRSDVGVYQNCLSGVGGRDPKYSTPLNIKKKCLITAIRLATHKCPPMTEKQTKTIKCVSCFFLLLHATYDSGQTDITKFVIFLPRHG